MKKGDVIRQKCVNTTFYLTGICAHKVNNVGYNVFSLLFVSLFFAFRTIRKISPQNERCYHGSTFDYVVQNIT